MRRILLILVWCLVASAQTQIRDTLYTGTGATFQGRIVVISPDMRTPSGRTVVRARTELHVSNGVVAIDLEPNDTAHPAGTHYVVQYFPRSGPSWSEHWVIPTSSAPLKVHEVRIIGGGGSPPQQQQIPNFADAEVPVGVIDGDNRIYNLAFTPSPPTSLILTRNGLILKRDLDYTLAGKTVTFTVEQTPQVGDILLAWYRY
jgi:hypothetical protein